MSTKNPRNEDLIIRFGVNVRRYRKKKDLTIQQLATECNVEYGTISTIEHGQVNCSVSTAFAISQVLEISLDILTNEIAEVDENPK